LISFYALPDDVSVSSVFADLGDNATGVIGESVVSANFGADGWIGSLTEVSDESGYWLKVNTADELETEGLPTGAVEYSLSAGNNLSSYSYAVAQSLSDALPASAVSALYGVAGEGIAALNLGDGEWAGSLEAFEGGGGYWLVANNAADFAYNEPTRGGDDLSRTVAVQRELPEVPSLYRYVQSMNQQFFFVNEATIDGEPLVEGDWIISYNDDVVVGARMWAGEYTDVPVMGYDGSDISSVMTAGYCGPGDVVTFKVYDVSQDKLVEMDSPEATAWIGNNAMSVISMSDRILPTEISLGNAYPNPFNPSTTITYDISSDMNVNINVYDVRGRMVAELVNGMTDQGRYEVMWNADNYSTGIYFVQLVAGNTTKTQKLMLVK
jgi:hypothetical protein